MSNNIGWCDCTINPIVGCSKCSPGCDNCYAERFSARLARNPQTAAKYRGVVDERGRWTGQVTTSVHSKDMPHRVPGKCKRVFVGSMTDLFHPNVSDATRDAIFASMLCDHVRAGGHGHTYLILTKRPYGMHKYFSIVTGWRVFVPTRCWMALMRRRSSGGEKRQEMPPARLWRIDNATFLTCRK